MNPKDLKGYERRAYLRHIKEEPPKPNRKPQPKTKTKPETQLPW